MVQHQKAHPLYLVVGQAQAARGGNRHIGRDLSRILQASGFCNLELDVIASDSVDKGVEPFLQHIEPDRMRSLVELGLLSEQDLERFREALTHFAGTPEAYTLWLSLMICGEKPYDV